MRVALSAVQRPVDGEQSLRTARLFDLIDGAGFESHGHWVRFVNAGIVELALDQNCDGDQRPLVAAAVELEKSKGARPFHLFFWLFVFGLFLGSVLRAFELRHLPNASRTQCGKKCQNHDDGGPQSAV